MVFAYLPVRDLLLCQRVSRHWRSVATSNPMLYTSIDLSVTVKPVTSGSVKALLRYAAENIRTLKIRPPEITFANFKKIIQTGPEFLHHANMHLGPLFKNLECLEQISSLAYSSDSLWSIPQFPYSTLRSLHIATPLAKGRLLLILCNSPALERLECSCHIDDIGRPDQVHSPPPLKVLTLTAHGVLSFSASPSRTIANWFPDLEEFTLRDYHSLYPIDPPLKLKVLRFQKCDYAFILTFPRNLKVLEWSYMPSLSSVHDSELTPLSLYPDLEELCIRNVRLLKREILQNFYPSAKTLRMLTISSPQFEIGDIEHFLREGTNLTIINISQISYVNDTTLNLLHPLVNLERLEIDHCHGVTGHGIIQLISKLAPSRGGRLKAIRAKGIESIRRQTVDWAWKFGVLVSI